MANQGRHGELGLGLSENNKDNNQDNMNNQENLNNQEVPPIIPARLVCDMAVPLTTSVASSIRKPPPSAADGQALAKTYEELFDLLDRLSEGNSRYEGEMPRTTTQRAAGILDVDQATALNAKLDAMQHNITMHFKQMFLNQAPVNMLQQAMNGCGVCSSGAHEIEKCEANPDFVNYVGNAQGGGGANQYRSQGARQQYQNPNQGANPSAPKGGGYD
uniref:Uncharacterized protein n=1 Tax=Solanum tuberosum TaxID=4113 RepID=M1DRW4_SOLTU